MSSNDDGAENCPEIQEIVQNLETDGEASGPFQPKEGRKWYQREGEEMSSRLWGLLNEDLQDRVLAWLPFDAFARARTVCKRWRAVHKSSSFLEMYARVPFRTAPSILVFDSNNWSTSCMYNPFVNRWHPFPFKLDLDAEFPCAAAGGLLCFCGISPQPTLYISNPMTKQWRELPPMNQERSPYVIGMVADESSKSFKIVVAGDYNEENGQSTEVFDSKLDRWTVIEGEISGDHLIPRNAFSMGRMFCFTGDPFGLVAFSIEQGTWDEVKAPMPAFLTSPHLVGCVDRLLLVGGVRKHVLPNSIRIWQLNLQVEEWEEMAVMPDNLCKRFLKDSSFGDFMCVGQDNFICFTGLRSKSFQSLMYVMDKRIWQWLPSCPLVSTIESYRLHVGMAFCPRLDMSVWPPSSHS